MSDLIRREDAIKAIDLRVRIPHDVVSAQYASMAKNAIYSVPSADRPQDDEFKNFDRESLILLIEAQKERIGELLADRPQEWIPCSERLPKWKEHTDDMVLVCYADGSVRFNTFMNWQWVQGEPIAWMPLPKPWKGADDETD